MIILKLYTDKTAAGQNDIHIVMLYPFWGAPREEPNRPESGRFDSYTSVGKNFFELASIDHADFAVLPVAWEIIIKNPLYISKAIKFIETVNQYGKQTIIFCNYDYNISFLKDNVVLFQTSLYRSKRKDGEFALPAWSEDIIQKYLNGNVQVRSKRPRPCVGFCGHVTDLSMLKVISNRVSSNSKNILRKLLDSTSNMALCYENKDSSARSKAIQILSKSDLVETNFVIRNKFWGGVNFQRDISGSLYNARQEFVKNILDSDYVICARGAGNFSYRLYETLCCGRIPIFIDTDCVLPYDFMIDWKKYCVWVPQNKIHNISEFIMDFHESMSDSDFIDKQIACRKLYEEYLSPRGFFRNFYRHFVNV